MGILISIFLIVSGIYALTMAVNYDKQDTIKDVNKEYRKKTIFRKRD